MQLIRYSPFQEFQKMERNLDKFWERGWDVLPTMADTSAMDLYEEDGNLVAEVSLPNFKKEEISITTDEGVLQVSAEHREEKEKKSKRHYYFRESSNQYFRRVALPSGANVDKADASFKDGTLKITIPTTTPRKSKAVTIK